MRSPRHVSNDVVQAAVGITIANSERNVAFNAC